MAIFQIAALAFRRISLTPPRWPTERLAWERNITSSSTLKARCQRPPYTVFTLSPEKMVPAGQQILDLSNNKTSKIRTRHGSAYIEFAKGIGFPPQSKGVLYFYHIPGNHADSQIRMRLCESVELFALGSDLMVKEDQPWNITVARMGPYKTYRPLLDTIKAEFGNINIPIRRRSFNIMTFSPDELVSAGQEVCDISGQRRVTYLIHPGKIQLLVTYDPSHRFPSSTRGVLYLASDDQRLRFRLCSKVDDFHRGSDLLLPSGKPWSHRRNRAIAFDRNPQTTAKVSLRKSDPHKNCISTLVPQKIISSRQNVINIHSVKSSKVWISNGSGEKSQPISLRDLSVEKVYRGFFYYHHVPGDRKQSQLRFRLCSTPTGFLNGEDALGNDGRTWNLSLQRMRGGAKYQPILNLIQKEYNLPYGDTAREQILTVSPQNIVSYGQETVVLGLRCTPVRVFYRDSSGELVGQRVKIRRVSSKEPKRGVLYYHHVPGDGKRSGLRFRLCSTPAGFNQGQDALTEAGGIWSIPLSKIRETREYQPILNLIQEEYSPLDDAADARPGTDLAKPIPPPSRPIIAPTTGHPNMETNNFISTLVPEKIISSGQRVIRWPKSSVSVTCFGRDFSDQPILHKWQIGGLSPEHGANRTGVFYCHYVPGNGSASELRFRLCSTASEFAKGEDAKDRRGRVWKRSLSFLSDAKTYQPLLRLIYAEFGHLVATRKPVLLLSQQILDISGRHDLVLDSTADTAEGGPVQVKNPTSRTYSSDSRPFPPDTVGVFYYMPSLTSPTQIGELRFRLCRHLSLFHHSEDLTFPTGDPWYIDAQQIYLDEQYRAVRQTLIDNDYLREWNPFLKSPPIPSAFSQHDATFVSNVSQPFSLELSRDQHKFWIPVNSGKWALLNIKGLFSPYGQRNDAYMGRVVARFEPYPQHLCSPSKAEQPPLLALRFLEVLTPIQRIYDQDFMKRPTPGELHMIRTPNVDGTSHTYHPWGFKTANLDNRKILQDFVRNEAAQKY